MVRYSWSWMKKHPWPPCLLGERVESLMQLREAISYHTANSDGLAGVAAVRQSTVQRGNELVVHSPQKSASS